MTDKYPPLHYQIVNDLLEGKFLLIDDDKKFQTLKENRNEYILFFEKTFKYNLEIENEFAYLRSDKVNEKLSRNFTIFLAILCYEINKENDDLKSKIEKTIFSFQDIEYYLKNENFEKIVAEIGIDDLDKFLKQLSRRNIIKFTDNNESDFSFTKAVNLFFDFAINLSKQQINLDDKGKASQEEEW